MKIAIATTDGTSVDVHFGKADTFSIYTFVNGTLTFIEKRDVAKYCSAGAPKVSHGFSSEKLEQVKEQIKDCSKVYIAKIGDKPKLELTNSNFEIVEYSGKILDIK